MSPQRHQLVNTTLKYSTRHHIILPPTLPGGGRRKLNVFALATLVSGNVIISVQNTKDGIEVTLNGNLSTLIEGYGSQSSNILVEYYDNFRAIILIPLNRGIGLVESHLCLPKLWLVSSLEATILQMMLDSQAFCIQNFF